MRGTHRKVQTRMTADAATELTTLASPDGHERHSEHSPGLPINGNWRAQQGGGIGQHYGAVPHLPYPKGARAGLRSFITMSDTSIHTAVDLLGRGTTEPPPRVDDLMTPVIFADLERGRTSEQYRKTIAAVEARQTALLTLDGEVLKVSIVLAADKDQTLAAITRIVTDMVGRLEAVGTQELKPAQEMALMREIADTVAAVSAKVARVAADNLQMAGGAQGDPNPGPGTPKPGQGTGSSGNGSSSGAPSGGSGGGESALGSIVSSAMSGLPMVAMMAMSALKNNDKSQNRDEDDEDRPDQSPPPPGNNPEPPAPGENPPPPPGGNPPPPPGATPAPQAVADPQQPVATGEVTGLAAGAASTAAV